jgi:hypothetical protein
MFWVLGLDRNPQVLFGWILFCPCSGSWVWTGIHMTSWGGLSMFWVLGLEGNPVFQGLGLDGGLSRLRALGLHRSLIVQVSGPIQLTGGPRIGKRAARRSATLGQAAG